MARRYPYVLQCDVEQFFPSIDLTILRAIIGRKIADEQVIWLVDRILNGGAGILKDEYEMVYFPGSDSCWPKACKGRRCGFTSS